jgi:class 3 adenylate cyclase
MGVLNEKRCKNKKKYIKYNEICVLFTDIVNYSKIANTYMDMIVYMILDDMYSKFDNLLKKFTSLQKIETIGDSYMVVGGLNKDNTMDVIIKEILQIAEALIIETKNVRAPSYNLEIRVGIHIGSAVIGILGKDKPRLCVIGNTVNIAARLQTNTFSDTIQISEKLYNKILDDDLKIKFTKKENVGLKNICSMNTYVTK